MTTPEDHLARWSILAFIQRFIQENDYPPSYREIKAQLGISSLSLVAYHLDKLEDGGYIQREPKSPRSIRVIEQTKQAAEEKEGLSESKTNSANIPF